MSRRMRPCIGGNNFVRPYGLHEFEEPLYVIRDAQSPDGYFLAREMVDGKQFPERPDIVVYPTARNWVQTNGIPAIVDFKDPDNYIEGRIYLSGRDSVGYTAEWRDGNFWDAGNALWGPRWGEFTGLGGEYGGQLHQVILEIRSFVDGQPTRLAAGRIPAGCFLPESESDAAITSILGQFDGFTHLTLSILPSVEGNTDNGSTGYTLTLTAIFERTRVTGSSSQGYLVTYWPASVSVPWSLSRSSYNLNSIGGRVGACRPSYNAPSDQAKVTPLSDTEVFGVDFDTLDEYYEAGSLITNQNGFLKRLITTRLHSPVDCPAIIPFSAKKAADIVLPDDDGDLQSPVPVISPAMQIRNGLLVNGGRDNVNALAFYDATDWQYTGDFDNSGYKLWKPPSGPLYYGEMNEHSGYGATNTGTNWSSSSIVSNRKEFNVVVDGPSSTCASWSDSDEEPPSSLTVSFTPASAGFRDAAQWLPAEVTFNRATNCAMDSVYETEIYHYSTMPNNNLGFDDSLLVSGKMLIVFSAPCDPFVWFDRDADEWKHKHAKALFADIFWSLSFMVRRKESERISTNQESVLYGIVTQRWEDPFRNVADHPKLYGAGLRPQDGQIGKIMQGTGAFQNPYYGIRYSAMPAGTGNGNDLNIYAGDYKTRTYYTVRVAPLDVGYVSEA